MGSSRPSSPTSLLWAYQLKREHKHLLDRTKKIEAQTKEHEARIKSFGHPTTNADITALEDRIRRFEQGNFNQRLDEIERRVAEGLKNCQARQQDILGQIATLRQQTDITANDNLRSLDSTKAVLHRMKEVEASNEDIKRALAEFRKETTDIQYRDELTKQMRSISARMKAMEDSMRAREGSQALRQENVEPQRELQRLSNESGSSKRKRRRSTIDVELADKQNSLPRPQPKRNPNGTFARADNKSRIYRGKPVKNKPSTENRREQDSLRTKKAAVPDAPTAKDASGRSQAHVPLTQAGDQSFSDRITRQTKRILAEEASQLAQQTQIPHLAPTVTHHGFVGDIPRSHPKLASKKSKVGSGMASVSMTVALPTEVIPPTRKLGQESQHGQLNNLAREAIAQHHQRQRRRIVQDEDLPSIFPGRA